MFQNLQSHRVEEADLLVALHTQAGIKIAGRNITNLRYADDTHPYGRKWRTKEPLDESEKREWKSWLKAQHLEN